jgi:hypothetical protein
MSHPMSSPGVCGGRGVGGGLVGRPEGCAAAWGYTMARRMKEKVSELGTTFTRADPGVEPGTILLKAITCWKSRI